MIAAVCVMVSVPVMLASKSPPAKSIAALTATVPPGFKTNFRGPPVDSSSAPKVISLCAFMVNVNPPP